MATAPLTLPSHTSPLTGLAPDQHGVVRNGRMVLPGTTGKGAADRNPTSTTRRALCAPAALPGDQDRGS